MGELNTAIEIRQAPNRGYALTRPSSSATALSLMPT